MSKTITIRGEIRRRNKTDDTSSTIVRVDSVLNGTGVWESAGPDFDIIDFEDSNIARRITSLLVLALDNEHSAEVTIRGKNGTVKIINVGSRS